MHNLKSLGFVVNPHAGPRKSSSWQEQISQTLEKAGISHTIVETRDSSDVEMKVRELMKSCGAVFAVGGDGTAHHVAQALAGTDHPFGLLPNGSGNDYSKMLRMPKGIQSGLQQLISGYSIHSYNALQLVVKEQHRAELVTRWSINTTGFGFDAAVSEMKTKVPVLRGIGLYLASSLLTLSSYAPSTLQTSKNDSRPYKGLMIAAGIGEFEGGGFKIFPGASAVGETFDVCEVLEHRKVRALPLLIKAMGGDHVGSGRIRMSKAKEITLTSDQPIPVHADGEVVSLKALEVKITLVQGALRVIVPLS